MGIRYIGPDVDESCLIAGGRLYENALLGVPDAPELSSPFRLDRSAARERAASLVDRFGIDTPDCDTAVQTLSGGNRQKLVLARETEESAMLVVAVEPTRGLDVRSVAVLTERLRDVARRGGAVLVAGYDVGQIREMADRIAVLYDGQLAAVLPTQDADPKTLVHLMMGGPAES
jgi:simple sugar transport system ATP-binding protein